jgi:hypothetical protein
MADRQPERHVELPALTPSAGLARLSPRALLAAGLVQALAKAARSFTLYEPTNALIRQFLGEYRARAELATAEAALTLDVSPFELATEGEVVYREEDRERSLAFRLFRDGVRRVTIAQRPSFDELLRLLEILAIRLTGIRQAEDDVVTLLRKAEFSTIEVVAVEGYTADEAESALRLGPGARAGPALDPRFDTPFPKLPAPGPITRREVPEPLLAALRREEEPDAVVRSALRVAEELLALGASGALPAADAARYCAELRDFLAADGRLGPLGALADLVRRQPDPSGRLHQELMSGLADPRLLDAVLAAIPEGATVLPPDAARLLPFVPAAAVLDRLASEESEGRRGTLLALAAARLPTDADAVIARLAALPAAVARTLAKALGGRAPARMADAAAALLAHPDESIQADALRAVGALAGKVPPARITALLASRSERIRLAAAGALERSGDAASARALAEALEARRDLSREEAAAFARALARLKPAVALRLFEGWLPVKRGLFRALRSSEREDVLRFAAVAGLGAVDGPEAEARIEAVAQGADEELLRHCQATLARRRAEGRHG